MLSFLNYVLNMVKDQFKCLSTLVTLGLVFGPCGLFFVNYCLYLIMCYILNSINLHTILINLVVIN